MYAEPPLVIVTLVTLSPVNVDVAVACVPPLAGAGVIVTVGALSYPYPASVIAIFVISLPSDVIDAVDCVFATGADIVTVGGFASS